MKQNNFKANTEFVVESDTLLLEYLFAKLENKSKNNVKSLLVRGNVSVNGKVITKHDYKLVVGQKVVIKWSQVFGDDRKELFDIIYEDNEIIVINKPSGLLSMSTTTETQNTAYHMVMDYVKRKNPKNRIFIVHRIDRDTSGVLLIAKNDSIKHALQENWSDIVTIRSYIAVVEGKIEKDSDTITSWLKETKTQLVYSSKRAGDGKEAITHYQKLKSHNKYSLLDVCIDTGRKNQIRVHMKDIGHNVVGDKKYGATTDPMKRLGLHAHILEFKHPITKKLMHFEAEIPNEFNKLFR